MTTDSRDGFRDALAKGRGRALLETLRAGALADEEAVIDASVHHRGYDFQVDGSRAPWMLEIIDAASAYPRLCEPIVARVLAGFHARELDGWDLQQSCELLGLFARRGSERARAALYELLAAAEARDAFAAQDPILAVDGLDGLVRIAAAAGSRFAQDQDSRWFDDLVRQAERRFGAEASRATLEIAAARDPGVRALLARWTGLPAQIETESRPRNEMMQRALAWSPAQVLAELAKLRPRQDGPWLRSWVIAASDADRGALIDALDAEADPNQLRRLLVSFTAPRVAPEQWRRAIPRMLALAAHAESDVRRRALQALARQRDPRVRALALSRLDAGLADEQTLSLLVANYEPADHLRIEALRPDFADAQEAHAYCDALLDIFADHPSAAAGASLQLVYERTPCAHCREKSVKQMLALQALPAAWAEECQFDSSVAIREHVAQVTSPILI